VNDAQSNYDDDDETIIIIIIIIIEYYNTQHFPTAEKTCHWHILLELKFRNWNKN
jgi:hypothetical protein